METGAWTQSGVAIFPSPHIPALQPAVKILQLLVSVVANWSQLGYSIFKCYFYLFSILLHIEAEITTVLWWLCRPTRVQTPRALLIHTFFGLDAENLLGFETLVLTAGTFLRYCAHQRHKANLILWIKVSNPQNSNSISLLRSDGSESAHELVMYRLMVSFHQACSENVTVETKYVTQSQHCQGRKWFFNWHPKNGALSRIKV